MECPVCAELTPYEAATCPHCGSTIASNVHAALDPASGSGTSSVDDPILGPYRVAWPSSFLAVVVASVVTIGIALLVGPSRDVDEFDDIVGNYLARHRTDGVGPEAAMPRSLPSPPTSGYADVESAKRSEPRAPLAPRSGDVGARSTSAIDVAAIGLLAIAIFHGISVGVLRATLSLAVLCAVAFAMRVWIQPFANWLQNPAAGPGVRYDIAPWLAGVLIGVGVLAVVSTYFHVMRQGARAVGRGPVDRIGGATIGVAEGMLAAVMLLFVTRGLLGATHELVASSHGFALLERIDRRAGIEEPISPDVASPPLGR